jgi:3-dehydroquinate synthase
MKRYLTEKRKNKLKEISISTGSGTSRVLAGESIRNIRKYAQPERTVIVTDENLHRNYSSYYSDYPVIITGTGEIIKTLSTVESIIRKLIEYGAHRKSFLLGIGGGIVCDIAGFAASIYMRGIPFGFVSTSLLSQVDASVGGKNGVNIDGLKNMAGVITQPEFVICDHSMLATLPEDQYINGMAELIKTGCLDREGLFGFISANREKLLIRDIDAVSEAVYRSVRFKAAIVQEDEREDNIRRILNLGHTLGHAVEKVRGVKHGFAVSAGIGFALNLSRKLGLIDLYTESEVKELLGFFGLPCSLNDVASKDDISGILKAVESDKKKGGKTIAFVLLKGIGESMIRNIGSDELGVFVSENFNQAGNNS